MSETNDVVNEINLTVKINEVLRRGMFTTNEEYVSFCAEVGVIVEIENRDFYYRLEGSDVTYGGGALGELYTIEEITWVAQGIDELRNIDIEGAKSLPIDELAVRVSEWLDANPGLWAARVAA